MSRSIFIDMGLAAIASATALPAHAQSTATNPGPAWPTKPIRMVVPFPAGGTSDILTRLIGAKLTESWGQQIVSD
ncbi:MAG TPA: tripartite tricarboxylate transporter substrate binding protein, partial [Burkholderiales bacterium]|nr:tripartite tricarboxylate transporter substrate binding protein [Burkholderiales bacterium]